MDKIGMTHNPADVFDHPPLSPGEPCPRPRLRQQEVLASDSTPESRTRDVSRATNRYPILIDIARRKAHFARFGFW